MSQLRSHLVIFAATALLCGCSFIDNVLTGEDSSQDYPPAEGQTVPIAPSAAEQNTQPTYTQAPVTQAPAATPPAVGTGNYAAGPVTPGASTGTYVGQKVAALRNAGTSRRSCDWDTPFVRASLPQCPLLNNLSR